MTEDKNISSYGWYVASYLLRFIEIDDDQNNNEEKRFSTWENTVLVKAKNLDQAYDKVEKIGKEASAPYKGGTEAIDVQWYFEGITNLVPIYEEIEDGSEIMWTSNAPRKLKNIQNQVRGKGEFHQ